MNVKATWRRLCRRKGMRMAILLICCLLIVITPAVAILPGPGGVFTFGIGAGLILRNSAWAKRRYVIFKRHWPKSGSWADWSLRRASARRRHDVAKAGAAAGD